MLGNLPLFLEHDELFDNDVVSYTFGDQEALYLRGQWTLHRNEPRISSVWIANPSPNPNPITLTLTPTPTLTRTR